MVWQSKVNKDHIHPGLVAVMDLTHEKLEDKNAPIKTYSGLRTFGEQDALFAKGRDLYGKVLDKKKIVTKARGGQSMHNYGLATDSAFLKDPDNPKGGIYWPDKYDPEWLSVEDALTVAAEEIDAANDDGIEYEWGGRWNFKDVPHIQVRFTLGELRAGMYPYCTDVEWLVKAHTTFLFKTPWMNRRVQHLLNMQSYSAGVVDGVVGKGTQAALTAFESDQPGLHGDDIGIFTNTVERLVRLHQTAMSSRDPMEDLIA